MRTRGGAVELKEEEVVQVLMKAGKTASRLPRSI